MCVFLSAAHLSSMWEQVSKTAHVTWRNKAVWVLWSQSRQTACGLEKNPPTKRCFWGQCPSKVLFALGGSFWDLLRPHEFVTPKGTPLPLQHMCNSYIYNLNIIDSHSYIYFFNSLKSLVRILLGRKCKLSIFKIFLCSLILESLIFIHNNSLE